MNSVITHQHQLLEAIFDCRVQGQFDRKGLSVYRENLRLSAIQSLRITFPTVHQLMGDEQFNRIAQQLLAAEPPQAGNWGSWGALMPSLLRNDEFTQQFPFIADCAQLDYLCHQLVRGADTQSDLESLRLMQTEPPAHLQLHLNPTLCLLVSDYPIAQIRAAHLLQKEDLQKEDLQKKDRESALLQISKLMHRQHRFHIACFRNGFQVQVDSISETEYQWLTLLSDTNLENALASIRSEDFSFQQWLVGSVQSSLLHKVVLAPNQPTSGVYNE